MTAAKAMAPDELRMSGKEFDRIMRQALQVKPEDSKPKKAKVKPRKKGAKSAA